MKSIFRHNLGDLGRDKITGLVGVITSRAEHLYGCARYWLSPREVKDGRPVDGMWLDEDQIEVIERAVVKPQRYRVVDADAEDAPLAKAGGPTSQPNVATGPRTR